MGIAGSPQHPLCTVSTAWGWGRAGWCPHLCAVITPGPQKNVSHTPQSQASVQSHPQPLELVSALLTLPQPHCPLVRKPGASQWGTPTKTRGRTPPLSLSWLSSVDADCRAHALGHSLSLCCLWKEQWAVPRTWPAQSTKGRLQASGCWSSTCITVTWGGCRPGVRGRTQGLSQS